jgi:hypothetical protein
VKGAKHCFVVISGNSDINGGNQTTYSLFPDGGTGTPMENDDRDVRPLNSGEASCSDVPDCTFCKEKKIKQNASNPGPSAYYFPTGPNSNTYAYMHLKDAGCTPPKVSGAPGYTSYSAPTPDSHPRGPQ